MKSVFQRNLETELLLWKSAAYRRPMIINGARQVGKTHLMKWLGTNHFEKVAYFNFDENPTLNQFFETTKDVSKIIENLSLVHGSIINEKTLIIFDEIQECLPALNALKYFYENTPDLYVICAGSLLGVSLGKHNSFPVGKVQFVTLYPLVFSEFLAQANPELAAYLQTITQIEPIPDIFFNDLIDNFKKYLIIGGLPAVAQLFLETKDFAQSDLLLKDLVKSYEFDFAKHPITKDIAKISHVFHSLASQLGRENKKFVFQLVKPGARAREYEDAIKWLEQAGLVYRVSLCKTPKLPLAAYDDLSAYKIYAFDVGVLRKLSKLNPIAFTEGNRLFVEFKGALIENYILQSLIPQFEVLPRYWTSGNEAEVDFLLQSRNEIIPVEVKADANVRSASLAVYAKKYLPTMRLRYSLKNLSYHDGLLNIPHFLSDYSQKIMKIVSEN